MIEERIKKLSEETFPERLHQKIMFRVKFLKHRLILLSAIGLLSLNFIIFSRFVWSMMLEADVSSAVVSLWAGFEMSLDFVFDFMEIIFSAVPPWQLAGLLLNIMVLLFAVVGYHYLNSGKVKFARI